MTKSRQLVIYAENRAAAVDEMLKRKSNHSGQNYWAMVAYSHPVQIAEAKDKVNIPMIVIHSGAEKHKNVYCYMVANSWKFTEDLDKVDQKNARAQPFSAGEVQELGRQLGESGAYDYQRLYTPRLIDDAAKLGAYPKCYGLAECVYAGQLKSEVAPDQKSQAPTENDSERLRKELNYKLHDIRLYCSLAAENYSVTKGKEQAMRADTLKKELLAQAEMLNKNDGQTLGEFQKYINAQLDEYKKSHTKGHFIWQSTLNDVDIEATSETDRSITLRPKHQWLTTLKTLRDMTTLALQYQEVYQLALKNAPKEALKPQGAAR